jgi:hypothetical protein
LLLKDRKEKRNNEQPTHKTAHFQAPTQKQTLRLAKELFFTTHHQKILYCIEKYFIFVIK